MSGLLDPLLNLSGPAAYAVVGLLAFGEAAAFIGLFVPGEVAVLLGGVAAATGRVSLPVMMLVVVVAAIAGDSAGYEIGRVFGRRLLARPGFHRRFGDKVERATAYLAEKGGRSVFLGRWTSVLRALIPSIAGIARMPYGQFLLFNVLGAVAWGCTFVLAGYAAGASWRRVEAIAGRASLILLGLILLGVALRWAAHRIAQDEQGVRAAFARLGRIRAVSWFVRRFGAQLRWLALRLTPGTARGLGWTISALFAAAAGWVFGIAVQDLLAGEELALLDAPAARWIATHTTPTLTAVAEAVVALFSPPLGLWLPLLAAAVAWRLVSSGSASRLALAVAMSLAIALVLRSVLPVTLPGTRFPSITETVIAATVAGATAAAAKLGWRWAVIVAAVGAMLAAIVGVADLVTAESALSGIVGGAGLGTLMLVLVEFTWRSLPPSTRDSERASGGVLDDMKAAR